MTLNQATVNAAPPTMRLLNYGGFADNDGRGTGGRKNVECRIAKGE